jgi:hypothetical protein
MQHTREGGQNHGDFPVWVPISGRSGVDGQSFAAVPAVAEAAAVAVVGGGEAQATAMKNRRSASERISIRHTTTSAECRRRRVAEGA